MQCPSCAQVQQPRLVCTACGAPCAADLDLFAALGCQRKLEIDPVALQAAYHEISRRIHPDRFATSPAAIRDASLRATALVTRAYRTLRDPVSRGLYWLELNGHKLAEGNKNVPPELAETVFEVHEEIAELRQARAHGKGTDGGAADAPLRARRVELQAMMEGLHAELARLFACFDADGGDRDQLFAKLKAVLSRIAYSATLARDVERELDSERAA